MGLMQRIRHYWNVERRDMQDSMLHAFGPGVGLTNVYPGNPRAAENLSTVLACVDAISSALASLSAYVYRFQPGGRGRSIDEMHPVARLVEQGPNQHQTWSDWIEWIMAQVLLRGNALCEVVTDARGAPIALNPIPWDNCSVQLLPTGRLAYDISEINSIYGGTGKRRLLQDEVLHLKDRSDNGLVGVSRLRRAAAPIDTALAIQNFANAIYLNGANPSGALEIDGKLSHEVFQRLKNEFRDMFSGSSNAAKALILENGTKWKQISINPEDAEFLASRRFTTEELARIFGVPAPVVGILDHSTFTNAQTLLRWFAQATLSPWIKKIESEFSRSVFSEATRKTHKLEIDLSSLLRGDPEQRWASWKIAVDAKILDVNEIREAEGWNPKTEGAPPTV